MEAPLLIPTAIHIPRCKAFLIHHEKVPSDWKDIASTQRTTTTSTAETVNYLLWPNTKTYSRGARPAHQQLTTVWRALSPEIATGLQYRNNTFLLLLKSTSHLALPTITTGEDRQTEAYNPASANALVRSNLSYFLKRTLFHNKSMDYSTYITPTSNRTSRSFPRNFHTPKDITDCLQVFLYRTWGHRISIQVSSTGDQRLEQREREDYWQSIARHGRHAIPTRRPILHCQV